MKQSSTRLNVVSFPGIFHLWILVPENKASCRFLVSIWEWGYSISFHNHNFYYLYGGERQFHTPYSGKLSGEKTFANFAVLWLYAKVFFTKFGVRRPLVLQKQAIRKSFIRENRMFTNSQKFSPSKVSRYMVFCEFTFHLIKTLSELSSFS